MKETTTFLDVPRNCRGFHRFIRVAISSLLFMSAPFSSTMSWQTHAAEQASFDELRGEYQQRVQPLLRQYCLKCHSTQAKEGELDLERFKEWAVVRDDPPVWQRVAEMLASKEMPPTDSRQMSVEQTTQLARWVNRYLDAEANAAAGDPGPVVLRRLSNAEYTYTIQDLTGVPLEPAKQFPVDGAAGEGFTNTGNALAMSPTLVAKYLESAKQISRHMVLLPDGIRFSEGTTRRDWTGEIVRRIRALYELNTSGNADVSMLDRWGIADPRRATDSDGRVDIQKYLAAIVKHRKPLADNLDSIVVVAKQEGLNATYLRHLARALVTRDTGPTGDTGQGKNTEQTRPRSLLLDQLRKQLAAARPDDVPTLAAEVGAWQKQLWKFNAVGHFGTIRPWQEAVSPLAGSEEFRLKFETPPTTGTVTLRLVCRATTGGDSEAVVYWRRPRIEFPGREPLMLRDVRGLSIALRDKRRDVLARTTRYLAAASEARDGKSASDIAQLAAKHKIDRDALSGWLSYLGISVDGPVVIDQYLDHRLAKVGDYDFVNGWTIPGASALSVIANPTDRRVNVPGDMRPHSIAVHPRPERWVAVGWKSPFAGRVRIEAKVRDAHGTCGNGVSYRIESRFGARSRTLRAGDVALGTTAKIDAIDDIVVRPGELVSLVIDARDRSHVCDLTEIDLKITRLDGQGAEQDGKSTKHNGKGRSWSLSGDCADSIGDGNPHADQYGNAKVWHFHAGSVQNDDTPSVIPFGSFIAGWLDETEPARRQKIASRIQGLLTGPDTQRTKLTTQGNRADRDVFRQLTALNGPLFSRIDRTSLTAQVSPEVIEQGSDGLAPSRFGKGVSGNHPKTTPADAESLVVVGPSVVEFCVPAFLLAGGEFVVSGSLHASSGEDACAQLEVVGKDVADVQSWKPGAPFVFRAGSRAEALLRKSFADYRQLFPAAMCHARIIPVDEVVTLVLFHREDEHLRRLMLDDDDASRLNRLWDELRYVSRDALTSVTAFEQLLEFATQDSDPSKFEPLRKSIVDRAESLRDKIKETQPAHVNAIVAFAGKAFRRQLSDHERNNLRGFYAALRARHVPHEDAMRLTLVRVLTSPAFLYRLEQPGAGAKPTLVSDAELASRLSYFLWASMPDANLNESAVRGQLSRPSVLREQAIRMLRDDRVRRLAVEFACQWMHIRGFDELDEKSAKRFPTFAKLRGPMYEESIRFFTDVFQNDRSVLSILDADHAFLNEPLAKHYGIPGVNGAGFRRIDNVTRYSRGGVLAQASFLSRQSGASRTSPILRGNWVSETMLGERLPRPPSDVPTLPEVAPDNLTERQLIERHTSHPSCAKCHVRIDPYGFALENFDAIGRFRTRDSSGHPIDTRTSLRDGTKLKGFRGLRDYLLNTRREAFLNQFCRKLLGYSLGRGVQLSDRPLLARMKQRLTENDFRFSVAVETIVASEQFRKIRGRDYRVNGYYKGG